ncbi:hypothetical protein D1007_11682 [Hordeum vulgare]|nr:hypothetical protein D1007_11682 [Hordeum vulgare]
MDQRKALFRAKLREAKEKEEKRIDPSLVRYNEYDQPIYRVCNITFKSEALWPAHQVSRKHHERHECGDFYANVDIEVLVGLATGRWSSS